MDIIRTVIKLKLCLLTAVRFSFQRAFRASRNSICGIATLQGEFMVATPRNRRCVGKLAAESTDGARHACCSAGIRDLAQVSLAHLDCQFVSPAAPARPMSTHPLVAVIAILVLLALPRPSFT